MFNRSDERKALIHLIQQGRSILMLAPRRIGKTWLMTKLATDLTALGVAAVMCDVQGMDSPVDFLREICRQIEVQEKLSGQLEGRLRQLWSQALSKDFKDGWQTVLGHTDWESFADLLISRLDARGTPTVILVDELALFVNDMIQKAPDTAKKFLHCLRALQQKYRNVRWFFTGSIGLDVVAARHGISGTLVDLELFPLEPFTPTVARAFLDSLASSPRVQRPFVLDHDGFTRLVAELGWLSPFYLDHIAGQIRPTGPTDPAGLPSATDQDVVEAFRSLLHPQRKTYFSTWEERLTKNFPRRQGEAMRAILGVCCIQPSGEQIDTLLTRLRVRSDGAANRAFRDNLAILATDGYLLEVMDADTRRYRFRSGLLRRYWHMQYGP